MIAYPDGDETISQTKAASGRSCARDRSDPEERWRLEELGGGIAARIVPEPPVDSSAAEVVYRDAVAVG
ncbi:MAG: hypothetical protein ISR77_37815 [Pirellulaceae bacterium]|nr:hypothetical protein [Pirellulaceae bacterium]